MVVYVIRRCLSLIFVIFVISVITFIIMYSVPGGPFEERQMPLQGAQRENILRKYGMTGSIFERYIAYVSNALRGDFGYSFFSPTERVQDLIARVWGPTLILGGITIAISLPLGMWLGILAAKHKGSPLDLIINTCATALTVIPGFVIAVALIVTFSARIRLLPSGGWGGPEHLVLPVIAYALGPTATLIRYIRGLTLDELGLDYVRTARAKGLAERLIIPRHVLRNLMIPLITVFGPTIPLILTGSVFIETTFRIPGLGQYLVNSSVNRDYPMVMALTLIMAVIWGLTLLITDILYVKLDPRVEL